MTAPTDPRRVDVVLDVEWLADGSVRVHCLGAFQPGHPRPAGANTFQTWLDVEMPRSPVGVFQIDTRTEAAQLTRVDYELLVEALALYDVEHEDQPAAVARTAALLAKVGNAMGRGR